MYATKSDLFHLIKCRVLGGSSTCIEMSEVILECLVLCGHDHAKASIIGRRHLEADSIFWLLVVWFKSINLLVAGCIV